MEVTVAAIRQAATNTAMGAVAVEALRALTNLCVDERGKPDARNQTAAVKEEAFVAVCAVLTQFRSSPSAVQHASRAVRGARTLQCLQTGCLIAHLVRSAPTV